MKWQISLEKRSAIIHLPNRIVDGEWFEAQIGSISYKARWNRQAQLLALIDPREPKLEQHIRARSLSVEKDPDDPESIVSLEVTSFEHNSTINLEAQAELYVPGFEHRKTAKKTGGTTVKSPIAGKVLKIQVTNGDRVTKGDTLLVIEAMKMENKIIAPNTGVVEDIKIDPGCQVAAKEKILTILPNDV